MNSDYLLFPEFRLSVANKIPGKFLSHDNLSIDVMMDFILRGKLPVPKIRSFMDDVGRLFTNQTFIDKTSDEKMKFLEDNYRDFRNWFETILSGEAVWNAAVRKEFENPGLNRDVERIVKFLDSRGYTSDLPAVAKELSDNFKVRKYKIRARIEGSIDNLFDSLNITDKCRQIVLVKPLEDRVQYKLSNKFGDKMTKNHSQRSLVDIPSRKNRLNNYIGMTFTKYKGSSKVVTVFIEERVPKTSFDQPILEIMIENLEDVDGEVVLKYFLQTISDISSRGKKLKETISKLKFDVYDVELYTTMYNKDFVRHALIDLSSMNPLNEILFSESVSRVDDQRFCLRGLNGKVRSRVDFQEKYIVFSSQKDIFEVFDLISLFLAYSINRPSIDILGLGRPIFKFTERVIESQDSRFEMDVIQIQQDGERVLKKARFFDSVFNKVCNKPENVPTFGESLDITKEGVQFDYFPPQSLIKKLTESGQFEFPRYETQRIPIQTFYGDSSKGKKADKVRILGKRRIPRERRDEMATSDNLAYIFGYFPCVVTMKKTEYEKNKGKEIIDTMDEEEEVDEEEKASGAEHIYDESKDEIPVGRVAKTQMFFFDEIKSEPVMDILRMGVSEGPASFFTAAGIASGRISGQNPGGMLDGMTIDKLLEDFESDPKIIQAGISQFPDSVPSEIKNYIRTSAQEFMDSKYLVNILGEFFKVNIIVMEYNDGSKEISTNSLDYAFYECPRGTIPPNIFEQLNMTRKTIILLRRKYQTIFDQYDFVLEKHPKEKTKITSLFDTGKVKNFLKTKIAFIDLVPNALDLGRSTSIVDLSKKHFSLDETDPLKEVSQVIDSVGSRIGTVFKTENKFYPCIHLTPLAPSVGLPVIKFNDLLNLERPSIETIVLDLGITKFTGIGETKTLKESYITSVMVEELIFLCYPTTIDERLKPFFNDAISIETPDPYILKQFAPKEKPSTLLLRKRFAEIVSYFLLQVIFLEMLERYIVKNTFETRTYSEWRRSVLENNFSARTPDDDAVPMETLLGFIKEIKFLSGFIPPSAISWFSNKASEYPQISSFFDTSSLKILCFSREMRERLDSQMSLMERMIPTLEIKTRVPKSVYRIKGLYETLVALSQSPESVNGVGSRQEDKSYLSWQEKCKTSFENTNIYEGIYKPFFNQPLDLPIIGFHGNGGGSGLWVMQSRKTDSPDTNSYPVFGNTLPRITYLKEKSFNVFLPENPDNKIHLKKLT